jgi:hypothetical protein
MIVAKNETMIKHRVKLTMKKTACLALLMAVCFSLPAMAQQFPFGANVTWDRHSLMVDGHRVCPVMGEVHYSRIPADEWPAEVRKMKEGGVTLIATYIFWNHVEEQEGIFNWSGQRDLRRFLEICKGEQMPVVLRVGPFCHGEVRCGGIPDWLFAKGCKIRSTDKLFLVYVERLYWQIFTQVQGLQWKDGGPVIAAQFDNEYRGSGEYLMALKRMALGMGYDLPFYTRTGWPALSRPVPFGELLPLYGDYADGFWEKSTKEGAGNYYKAFNFKAFRSSTAIGTDLLGEQKAETAKGDDDYPYFTCELGGGMATAYHRRPYVYPEDAYSMAVVKLGSGSNLLGYYMYHGGTNPESMTGITLNETVHTLATANNDLNVKSYDFQAPLGEFGQCNEHYYMLRKLHLFMRDWGEQLAPMEASFPGPKDVPQGYDDSLRWTVREKDGSGFIFINNYERLQSLTAKKNVVLKACGVTLPKLTIPAATVCIFPVNIDGISYATAQLVAKSGGKIYMQQVPGIPTTIALRSGKTLKNVKPRGTLKPVCENIYLLTEDEANRLFLDAQPNSKEAVSLSWEKVKDAGTLRKIVVGAKKVAEAPSDEDFNAAAVYTITLPDSLSGLMTIRYRGDVARLYANGKLIDDNFYNGRPFCYALRRLPKDCRQLELRILPLQANMPVYLPREADHTPGETVGSITVE